MFLLSLPPYRISVMVSVKLLENNMLKHCANKADSSFDRLRNTFACYKALRYCFHEPAAVIATVQMICPCYACLYSYRLPYVKAVCF